jgi:hypothetical protein
MGSLYFKPDKDVYRLIPKHWTMFFAENLQEKSLRDPSKDRPLQNNQIWKYFWKVFTFEKSLYVFHFDMSLIRMKLTENLCISHLGRSPGRIRALKNSVFFPARKVAHEN